VVQVVAVVQVVLANLELYTVIAGVALDQEQGETGVQELCGLEMEEHTAVAVVVLERQEPQVVVDKD